MIGYAVMSAAGHVIAHCRYREDAEAIFDARKDRPEPILKALYICQWLLPEEIWDEDFRRLDGSRRDDLGGPLVYAKEKG